MAKQETVRIARLGPHTTMMGFTPPEACEVCKKEPPYIIFVNETKKLYAWLCETCFEKGYPEIYEEAKFMDSIKGDVTSIPPWSKGTNRGG